MFAFSCESISDVSFELLVIDHENDSAAEIFNRLHECLCLLLVLVVRCESIDNGARGEHLWEYWLHEVCQLLHVVLPFLLLGFVLCGESLRWLVQLIVVHELSQVIFLFHSYSLRKFLHLLV